MTFTTLALLLFIQVLGFLQVTGAPPAVHIFAKKSVRDSSKLNLTCLITGFYPKDVEISLKKFRTSLPEHLITSSGVRPNDDGTYQLRKSVEIPEDDSADYYCYVSHRTFTEPVIKHWDGGCTDCPENSSLGLIIGGAVSVFVILLCPVMLCVVIWRRVKRARRRETDLYLIIERICPAPGKLTPLNTEDSAYGSRMSRASSNQSLGTENDDEEASSEEEFPDNLLELQKEVHTSNLISDVHKP